MADDNDTLPDDDGRKPSRSTLMSGLLADKFSRGWAPVLVWVVVALVVGVLVVDAIIQAVQGG